MNKKRLLVVSLLLLALLGIGLGAAALIPQGPGVTKANFDRIEMGMTWDEVDRIFGEPSTEHVIGRQDDPRAWAYWWATDGSSAAIAWVDGRVAGKEWNPSPESLFDKIRRWLHL